MDIRSDSILKPIPIELYTDYRKDSEKAHRDFGAVVTRKTSKFIKDVNLIKRMFDEKIRRPWDENMVFYNWFRPGPNYYYHIHIDLAKSQDRCGIAMGHQEIERTIIDFAEALDPKVMGGEIDFEEVRMIIRTFEDRGFQFNVTYDSWQSVDSIQQLRKRGIEARLFSVDKDIIAYTAYKRAIYERSIKTYFNQLLYDETKDLDRIEFDKIDHPVNGSKDLSDAVAAVTFHCREEFERELRDGVIG